MILKLWLYVCIILRRTSYFLSGYQQCQCGKSLETQLTISSRDWSSAQTTVANKYFSSTFVMDTSDVLEIAASQMYAKLREKMAMATICTRQWDKCNGNCKGLIIRLASQHAHSNSNRLKHYDILEHSLNRELHLIATTSIY